MSFCQTVKNDLVSVRSSACCKPALLYGFMLFGRSFSIKRISIQTANENVANHYLELMRSVYGITPKITKGGTKIPTFKAEVVSEADRLKVLASVDFGVEENLFDAVIFERECCLQSFVRGIFLACGNINNPEKEYRAEFNVKNEKAADELLEKLKENGIRMRKVARASGFLLYTKDSSTIEDLLTFIGCGKRALELIDTKIEKSFKNNVNRAKNCDDANISKTVEASIKQRIAIEYLIKTEKLESLPEELSYVAKLRLENPDATLKELCKISSEPLTVSGLNHRLSKLIAIYNGYCSSKK